MGAVAEPAEVSSRAVVGTHRGDAAGCGRRPANYCSGRR